jgi:hypothetical protein
MEMHTKLLYSVTNVKKVSPVERERRKKGTVRWEMGDGRWEMGDGRWEMGDGRWEMGDGRWERIRRVRKSTSCCCTA